MTLISRRFGSVEKAESPASRQALPRLGVYAKTTSVGGQRVVEVLFGDAKRLAEVEEEGLATKRGDFERLKFLREVELSSEANLREMEPVTVREYKR